MRVRRGFTIVEIVIVMVIIAVLLGVGVLSVTAYQANGRDAERNADMSNIARGLETRYKEGNPSITAPAYAVAGTYPSINEMKHVMGQSVTGFSPAQIPDGTSNESLPGTDVKNFSPPTDTSNTPYGGFRLCDNQCLTTAFTDAIPTNAYYYAPLTDNETICVGSDTEVCSHFKLIWRNETDSELHVIESRRR